MPGRSVVLPLTVVVAVVLCGCAGPQQQDGIDPVGRAEAARSSAPAVLVRAPPLPSDPAGPGALLVAMTSPVAADGYAVTTVTCAVDERSYRVHADRAGVGEVVVTADVNVSGYAGPGEYPAIVTASVVRADGTVAASTASGVPVQVRAADRGAFRHEFRVPDGPPLAVALSWWCSP